MVKIFIDGKEAHIAFDDSAKAVAYDVATAISGIYQGLSNKDEEDAAFFKYLMQRSLEDGSPVWEANHKMTMLVMPIKKSDTPADQS